MAEAANTPETETIAVEGMVSLPASAPASVPAENPKSPVEVKEDQGGQVDTEVDLTVQEPPEKRARQTLEDQFTKLMERTREGYDMTAAALEKVYQHLDISRQLGKDLTQLAQEVRCEKIGAKYQLAQLQQVLSSFQNLEWQVGGSKQESNTSIKSLVNKLLAASTTSKEALKSIHGELREGNDWIPTGISTCPNATCGTTNATCGTISSVRDARIRIELSGGTSTDASNTTSDSYGTGSIFDVYAVCSNRGPSWNEPAATTAVDFDGG